MTQENKHINNEANASSNLTKKLADLRYQLQRNELEWSETADSLIADLLSLATDTHGSPQDFEMLSLVIDAALHGDDVAKAYPEFYRRMQAHPDLQKAFFDILETILSNQVDDPLPAFPPSNLDFLHQDTSPAPTITYRLPNRWRASWRILSAYLNQQFMLPLETYRSDFSVLDEDSTLLLHNKFEIGSSSWQATLEAVSLPGSPNQLGLFLSVMIEQSPLLHLQATLQWGDYNETAVLDPYGRAQFPPIDLSLILDETGTIITQDMLLDLQPT